jgi:hypothetical protein
VCSDSRISRRDDLDIRGPADGEATIDQRFMSLSMMLWWVVEGGGFVRRSSREEGRRKWMLDVGCLEFAGRFFNSQELNIEAPQPSTSSRTKLEAGGEGYRMMACSSNSILTLRAAPRHENIISDCAPFSFDVCLTSL